MAKKIKSILQDNLNVCFCLSTDCAGGLEIHHVIYGRGRRAISDREGLVVALCEAHHRGTAGVHGRDGEPLGRALKEIAQEEWELNYKKSYPYKNHADEAAREAWIRLMGRNYLDE